MIIPPPWIVKALRWLSAEPREERESFEAEILEAAAQIIEDKIAGPQA